ncbi:MAG TPA: glutathione S-transferase N-terminal domain-containing protein [Polyangium sp.]|uniref:glutathione transferase n=1 Tax=Polyangium mundeleinium TaxID=2995306 RepID=A0ABT5F630_9BACT|nr:glutathione S-transferase N-terminal domain-containing protein [Polyangium mundeleinium]MDC0748555.1 glutathione S-transferase N-terminal domain-containing protein [Polyangium mundeleinium]HVK70287.1 glutathione S-transferase N-terminal domain-containing protein [Polyangium sp.]
MKVYGHPASTCTRKLLCALAEKGVDYEFVLVDIMKGDQKSAEHLARHPFGVVPVLDDDGFVLYESRAILRYLNAKLGGLAPTDAKDLGIMEQWISVEQSYFSPPAMKAILEIFFSPMKGTTPDQDVIAKGKAEAAKALDVLDRALVGKEFLAGSFSIAEITYAPYFQYLFDTGLGDIVKERPNVAAWWSRISERPSWQKAIGKAR